MTTPKGEAMIRAQLIERLRIVGQANARGEDMSAAVLEDLPEITWDELFEMADLMQEAAEALSTRPEASARLCPTCDTNRRCAIQITLHIDDPRLWDGFEDFGCSLWRPSPPTEASQ